MITKKKRLVVILIIIAIFCIIFFSFVLRSCDSYGLVYSPMYIPPWVNYPVKFRHIKGWIYKFDCPENWPWSRNRKTIIGLAITGLDERFILDWQIFEIVGGIIKEKVFWEDFERFTVLLIEQGNRKSSHPYGKKLIKEDPRIILKLIFTYDSNEDKFYLHQMRKQLNNTVRKIDKLPTNWHLSSKSPRGHPYLLDK